MAVVFVFTECSARKTLVVLRSFARYPTETIRFYFISNFRTAYLIIRIRPPYGVEWKYIHTGSSSPTFIFIFKQSNLLLFNKFSL